MSMLKVLPGLGLSRVRVLATGVVAAAAIVANAAQVELYMAPFDRAVWQVEKSALSCRLHQAVPNYGSVIFETSAGSPQRFYATAEQNPMQSGPSQLVANPPSWNPERSALPLGSIEVAAGRRPIQLDETQAQALVDALRSGLVPELTRPASADAEQSIRLGVSPVNFQRAYAQYEQCTAQLLPFTFAQMANTPILFAREQVELDGAARKKIDLLLRYIKAERGPVKIDIKALSDDNFRRLDNLALAKQRTQHIQDYLLERGIQQQAINISYRTERGGKELSKRYVTIQLNRTVAAREP